VKKIRTWAFKLAVMVCVGAVSAALLSAAAPAAGASVARANLPVLVVCSGSQTQTYNPGLTLTQRTTTTDANTAFTLCLGGPLGTTATAHRNFTGNLSCLVGTLIAPFTFPITWSNGQTSTISATSIAVSRITGQTVVELLGTITAGRYKNALYSETLTMFTTQPTACLAEPGLTQVSGLTNVVITGLI
jgi:hypothetical protein